MTTPAPGRPLPAPDEASQPFFDAAKEGKLLLRHCANCDRFLGFDRELCDVCFNYNLDWKEASGKGEIYSHSTMRRVPEPYTLAYVTLAEGPKMLTNIVDCDVDKLKIGQKVHVVFKPAKEGPPIPAFAPD